MNSLQLVKLVVSTFGSSMVVVIPFRLRVAWMVASTQVILVVVGMDCTPLDEVSWGYVKPSKVIHIVVVDVKPIHIVAQVNQQVEEVAQVDHQEEVVAILAYISSTSVTAPSTFELEHVNQLEPHLKVFLIFLQ